MPLAMTGPQVCWKRTRKSSAAARVSSCACGTSRPSTRRDDRRERLVVARGEQPLGALGGLLDDGGLLGVDPAAGHDVGAVAVHRDEQGLERAAHGGVVDVAEHPAHEPHQPVDLGGLHVVDDEPLGLGDDVVEARPGRARPRAQSRSRAVEPGGRA